MTKLNFKVVPTNLGGAALPDCGTIHITEVKPTLDKLSQQLDLGIDLSRYVVGSTGKRDYSGDIDIVLDTSLCDITMSTLYQLLSCKFDKSCIRKLGKQIHLRYPIENYNASLTEYKPRTGQVQIDFNIGDFEWDSFYYYTDAESAYKSAHRNIVINSVAAFVNEHHSTELDNFSRPIETIRWKWSIAGFSKVSRQSKLVKSTGLYAKTQQDVILDGPHFDKKFIASTLFPVTKEISDLNSLETVIQAVKSNYPERQTYIFGKMAKSILSWDSNNEFDYPIELQEHICYLQDS